jgi:hypothetical protein
MLSGNSSVPSAGSVPSLHACQLEVASRPRAWNMAEKLDIAQFFWSHKTHSTRETMGYAYQKYHKTLAASTLSGWKVKYRSCA